MKVLVTGSADLPGREVLRQLEIRGIPCAGLDTDAFDLTDTEAVRRCVESCAPDAIIHCGGCSAEDEADSLPEKCAAVNGFGTLAVARAAAGVGAKLLYLSSAQVFPGTGETPFGVSAPYGPKTVYGMSKVQAEDAVRSLLTRYFIVRSDWFYGTGEEDFIRPLLLAAKENKTLRIAGDQAGSPTWAADLARVLCDLVETESYGIWHARNEGYCSRAEFAEMALRKTGVPCRVVPVPAAELSAFPQQPLNLRLRAELPPRIAPMASVEDALDRCLSEMGF